MEENDVSLNLEDMYTLTPLQHGMLLHSDMATSDGMYIAQLSFSIQGEFQFPSFLQAWQEVIDRHAILRTAFLWGENVEPQQLVFSGVSMPFIKVDLRHLSREEQAVEIEETKKRDRKQKFLLDEPPLMRFTFLQTDHDAVTCIWSYHHVLMDGWSLPIILGEVFQYYEAISGGESLHLPTPKAYRDYIAWLKRQDQKEAKAFWQEMLKGYDTPLSLRFDRNETKEQGYQYITKMLSQEMTSHIQEMGKRHGLTISTILQAAWGLLLGRTHYTEDVLFGATSSGRPTDLAGSENMVGLFINTAPVRVTLTSETILTWLLNLQARQVEAREYSFSSLVDIQSWSEIPRGSHLFESIVVVENYPIGQHATNEYAKWRITEVDGREETHYPITLVCTPGEKMQVKIMYQADRFARSTIEDILLRLVIILEQMVYHPEQKVDQISILTKPETKLMLEDWNQTAVATRSKFIHQWFEEQVKRTPHQIAVTWGHDSLTYEQLNQKSNQLAHYLISAGISREKIVAVLLPRSTDLLVSLLAILKAGGAYVPLDPKYPKDRIAYMLEDSDAQIVLTTEQLSSLITTNTTTCCIDRLDLRGKATNNPNLDGTANQLAYVIYTSGSTGKPKGVMVEHHSVSMLFSWAYGQFHPDEYSGVLASTSICFDLSVFELFFPLSCGGTVVGVENALYLTTASDLVPITLINTVPSVANELVQMNVIPDTVRTINLAGESLSRSLVDELYLLPQIEKVYNLYGPSEDTTYSTFSLMERKSRQTPSIGRPIDNTTVYVFDSQRQPVPAGIPGELYLGGEGLTRGYLNRPDLTDERYLPHPLDKEKRVYRTGDLVRFETDGTLQYIGRVDHQVKMRGYRIELGEIEATLHAHPNIKKSVVVAKDSRLIAYVITTDRATDYEAYLTQYIPSYMIPSQFVFLDVFPLTPNGKVDRNKLPAPGQSSSPIRKQDLSPSEEIVAGVWEQVLGVKPIQADDNFFQVGGHSLLATQVISKLAEIWNKEIPLTYIFEFPTVKELAAKIEGTQREQSELTAIPVYDRSNQFAPASYGQRRLWFLDQIIDDRSTYHLPYAIRIEGTFDILAFRRSLQAIAIRHESLRTTFTEREGIPIQVIHQVPPIDFSYTDIRQEEESLEQLISRAYHQSFSLTSGPLWRAHLYQETEDKWVLLFTFHHIIMDGWSLGIFGNELFRLYEANCRGKSIEIDALPLQYRDYSAWQQDYIHSDDLKTHLHYWKDKLSGVPVLHLPTDKTRPAEQTFRGRTKSFEVPLSLTEGLKQLSKEEGVTLYMSLLASWQIWLSRYSGQEDIAVGSPVAGRTRSELENLIGFFVNTLVLRTDLSGNPSFQELLSRVRQTSMEAYANQHVPFEKMVDELAPDRNLQQSPLFQVMFVLQNMPVQTEGSIDVKLSPFPLEHETAKYDLTLTMMDTPEGLQGAWEYNADLFSEVTIDRMIKQYVQVLETVVADPTVPIREISLLTREDERFFAEQNQLISNYPAKSIAALFEEQVSLYPSKIALQSATASLTYEEVNQQANQLAHFLQKKGVQSDIKVGICLDRSIELIIAMLAIVKTGAAYVPFDVSYPIERFQYLVTDSEVSFVVTTQKWTDRFQNKQMDCCMLDEEERMIRQESTSNLVTQAKIDFLAYVMYTSGSTGKPKGVEIPQKGIIRLVKNTDYATFSANDVFLQLAPVAFDAATFEIWGALLNGAKLAIMPSALPSLSELGKAIQSYEVTTLWLTAGLFRLMVDHQLHALKGLKQLLTGGDVVSPVHVQKVLHMGGVQVINGYGPTENTTFSCCYQVPQDWSGDVLPIGKPIAGTTAYVLDDMLQQLPVGIVGELYVGGDGLAKGYANQPLLTQERFIEHEKFGRLYRTGDLVRYLYDGTMMFLGRKDHQVKIRGFRVELGEIETTLAQLPKVKDAIVIQKEGKLIAYLTSLSPINTNELRDQLVRALPDYMVPASFVLLDELPLTENGKVNRNALPSPAGIHILKELPQGEIEQKIAIIWQDVLGISMVNRNDNFFRLGGDSILSLQVVAKATQQGIGITPKQMFQFQTIEELAKVAIQKDVLEVEQGVIKGKVDLTPIQSWFFAQKPANVHHFNQAVMVQLNVSLSPLQIEETWRKLHEHHDSLRLQFRRKDDSWQASYGEESNIVSMKVHDISNFEEQEQMVEMKRFANYYQRSLDLAHGPITRLIYFHLGAERKPRLLIIAHHLVVDGVSWRIILEDLATLIQQLAGRQAMILPAKTTSYQRWAQLVQEEKQLNPVYKQIDFEIPVDQTGENTEESSELATFSFSKEETEKLVKSSAKAEDILLTAFVRTIVKWTSNSNVLVDLEGHGRDVLGDDIDVSRTVGWFTKLYSASFQVKENVTALEALRLVKDQRNAAFHQTKFGQTKSISPVNFNYFGQFRQLNEDTGVLIGTAETVGETVHPKMIRSYILEGFGVISKDQLTLTLRYSKNIHRKETIEELLYQLCQEIRILVSKLVETSEQIYTPADFPLASLSAHEFNMLPSRGVESIYPLSPLQKGMLFHSQYAKAKGEYITQIAMTLEGQWYPDKWTNAWKQLIARHEILRTSFWSKGLKEAHQIVHERLPIEAKHMDWQQIAPEEQETSLVDWLKRDQEEAFDLSSAPLMRIAFIRLTPEKVIMVWTHHHILLDGWSLPLVLQELMQLYQQKILPKSAPPYRRYIEWLRQQSTEEAEQYWKTQLKGITAATLVRKTYGTQSAQSVKRFVNKQLTEAIQQFAREQRLTMNTVVQGAWALLLQQMTQQTDLLYGTTSSGRPAELTDSNKMIGLFIQSLPTRVDLDTDQSVAEWLQTLQLQQLEQRKYEYVSLVDIQSWSDIPRGTPLFGTLFVFENYPTAGSEEELSHEIRITDLEVQDQSNVPLVLVSGPGEQLLLKFQYLSPCFTEIEIEEFLDELVLLLEKMITVPTTPVKHLCQTSHIEKLDSPSLQKFRPTSKNKNLLAGMTKIWEEVLSQTPIGLDQNFFDLGGHSFDAMAIASRVEQDLGFPFALSALFQCPTIGELCYYLEHQHSIHSVITLQQGNGRHTPLFLIHGQGGGVLSYHHLVAQLNDELTIYGIQARGYEGEADIFTALEEMIDYYVSLIKQVQPAGPYRLGGWSLGGVLAHGVTAKLEQMGDTVEFLAMIDSTWLDQEESELLYQQLKSGAFLPTIDSEKNKLWLANGIAFARYQLENMVRTPIHLFVAENRSQTIGSSNWAPWTASTVYANIVDGNHVSLLEKANVKKLADDMGQAIQATKKWFAGKED
ncbi:amino acid adenylation domain-containing protein [Shimazuella sp. AN120528]|uniref:non-ribosomal peptide synthetase n=1 Tax=Shimazuella soli TaxID=1892854 RepID=UPI001F0D20FD|nr:non-ribosomal peptide synthetase [Shimazuella soli]MCH5586165.1 amino acid adenylation domain-containing protein [Shimazuella soli]